MNSMNFLHCNTDYLRGGGSLQNNFSDQGYDPPTHDKITKVFHYVIKLLSSQQRSILI